MIILRKLYSAESDERFVNGGGFADTLNLMKKKRIRNKAQNLVTNTKKKLKDINNYLYTTEPETIVSDGVQKLVEAPIASVGTAAGYGSMATGLYIPGTTPISVAVDSGVRKIVPYYDKVTKKIGKRYRNKGHKVVKDAVVTIKNSLGGMAQ